MYPKPRAYKNDFPKEHDTLFDHFLIFGDKNSQHENPNIWRSFNFHFLTREFVKILEFLEF